MLFACVPPKRFQRFKILCVSGHRLCMGASTFKVITKLYYMCSSLKFFMQRIIILRIENNNLAFNNAISIFISGDFKSLNNTHLKPFIKSSENNTFQLFLFLSFIWAVQKYQAQSQTWYCLKKVKQNY